MPLANKASRKVRVAFVRPKVSSLRSRCSEFDDTSGNSGVALRLSSAKKKWGDQNRSNPSEAALGTGLSGRFSKSHTRAAGISTVKRGHGVFGPVRGEHLIRNRKISYADSRNAQVGFLDGKSKKYNSEYDKDKFISRNGVGNKVQQRKRYGSEDSSRTSLFRGKNSKGNGMKEIESFEKSKFHGNGLRNGPSKTFDKPKIQLLTEKYMNQRQRTVGSVEKPHQKLDRGSKYLNTNSELVESLPRKKKRVFRLDPHDLSNKRLTDDASVSGNNEAKPDLNENVVEMSKNAQFRSIKPSSSILSYVEDNFLGRRRDIELRRAGYNTEISAPLDNIPSESESERERIEVPVFRNKLEFFAAAKTSYSFPSPDLPEIAFAGRSNVGKSSLLNALTRQWGVARTSDKPGLTQTINFFKLGPKLSLVDLPGYGFAYAKEEVKEAWQELVKEYVSSRSSLKRVCLLVDTKWGMKPRDSELIDLMEQSQTKYQIVLTKTDLVFPIDVARRAMEIEENLKANKFALQPLMMVSSRTGAGIRSLRSVLANVARFAKR